jgi:hypothetical protein
MVSMDFAILTLTSKTRNSLFDPCGIREFMEARCRNSAVVYRTLQSKWSIADACRVPPNIQWRRARCLTDSLNWVYVFSKVPKGLWGP